MALQFTRNAKVYIELQGSDAEGSPAANTVWEVPVLDGFSFSQSMDSTEITINEAGSTSRRSRLLFNTALAPVEWSFSTYARPFKTGGAGTGGQWDGALNDIHCVEEPLWAMLLGGDTFTTATAKFSNESISPGVDISAPTSSTNTLNFNGSNVSGYSTRWNIYFAFEDSGNTQVYKLDQAICNSMTMDFDIEGIATIQWSGFAKQIIDNATTVPTRDIYENITSTSSFIRNRISTLSLVRTDSSPDDTYDIILTGGNFTIENNISYLTPEELGKVNQPFANITGTRSISGSVTCYLDTAAGKSADLLADLAADTTTVRNVFDMAINIGGTTASTPRITFDLPTAHVEVPTIGVEDLLTLEVMFHGQPSGGDVDNTDEATIIYRA